MKFLHPKLFLNIFLIVLFTNCGRNCEQTPDKYFDCDYSSSAAYEVYRNVDSIKFKDISNNIHVFVSNGLDSGYHTWWNKEDDGYCPDDHINYKRYRHYLFKSETQPRKIIYEMGMGNNQYDTFAILRISYAYYHIPQVSEYDSYQFLLSPWYKATGIDTIVNGNLYKNVIVLNGRYYPRTTMLFSFLDGIISIAQGDSLILAKIK